MHSRTVFYVWTLELSQKLQPSYQELTCDSMWEAGAGVGDPNKKVILEENLCNLYANTCHQDQRHEFTHQASSASSFFPGAPEMMLESMETHVFLLASEQLEVNRGSPRHCLKEVPRTPHSEKVCLGWHWITL